MPSSSLSLIEESNVENTKRKLYFCSVDVKFSTSFGSANEHKIKTFYSKIAKLSHDRSGTRYQTFGERILFMREIKFARDEKFISGILYSIRKDIFPEIINMTNDELRSIDGDENEGIAEATHFVIDYTLRNVTLCLEYNQSGAKLSDFNNYSGLLGVQMGMSKSFNAQILVPEDADLSFMNSSDPNISEFTVKVLNKDIETIRRADEGLYSTLRAAIGPYKAKYVQLKMKFDYRNHSYPKLRDMVRNVLKSVKEDIAIRNSFEKLELRAENPDNGFKMELFDLLIEKFKKEITVEKKRTSRTIITKDIIPKIKHELIKIR